LHLTGTENVVNTVALSRNPSRTAAAWNAVAEFGILISRCIRGWMKIGKDRRALQAVPAYLLADMGLERLEIRTTSGNHAVWIAPRRC
jgi:uncharacterized protein YjiS (DUF1127 family)